VEVEGEEGVMGRRNRRKRKWGRKWRRMRRRKWRRKWRRVWMRRKIWWVLLLGNEMPPSVFLLDRKKSAGLTG
jgi:hypothetical protein